RRWKRMNTRFKRVVNGKRAPTANDELLFYQTLVGVWDKLALGPGERSKGDPLGELKDRLVGYSGKGSREAQGDTSCNRPKPDNEEVVTNFVRCTLKNDSSNDFLPDFASFHSKLLPFACLNSLSQLLLKLTSPGVPDTYQGTEFWDLNLVDPDDRRSVDYGT